MPSTYLLASDETKALLEQVREQFHPRLDEAEIKIGIIMAFAAVDDNTGEKKGHAIKGYAGAAAAAQVKSVPTKDRLTKNYDVELLIDGDNWPTLSEAQKIAILDHEMTHILPTDKLDDLRRPKVRMRDEDFIAWGFWEVIQRHGVAAMEHRALTILAEKHGQLLLGLDPAAEAKRPGVESYTFGPDALKAAGNLGKVMRESGATMAVSVNGGPEKDMNMSQLGQEISQNLLKKRGGKNA